MDVNETLRQIRSAIVEYNDTDAEDTETLTDVSGRLVSLVSGLDDWLSDGGFLPEEWRQ